MIHIVLFEPEIPPNTGNIIRLCANTGFYCHLIEPLGFRLEDKALRRAGLDYHEWASVQTHPDFDTFLKVVSPGILHLCSTKGLNQYTEAQYHKNDALVFGPETRGLPMNILERFPKTQWLRIPMRPMSRSLNLSNSVAIVAFEAWKQLRFVGGQ